MWTFRGKRYLIYVKLWTLCVHWGARNINFPIWYLFIKKKKIISAESDKLDVGVRGGVCLDLNYANPIIVLITIKLKHLSRYILAFISIKKNHIFKKQMTSPNYAHDLLCIFYLLEIERIIIPIYWSVTQLACSYYLLNYVWKQVPLVMSHNIWRFLFCL